MGASLRDDACRSTRSTSVRTAICFANLALFNKKWPLNTSKSGPSLLNGRGGEIRTPDPHNPIVVRYQAALRPDR